MDKIDERVFEEAVRRGVERVFSDNAQRFESYYAEVSSRLNEEMRKAFPL